MSERREGIAATKLIELNGLIKLNVKIALGPGKGFAQLESVLRNSSTSEWALRRSTRLRGSFIGCGIVV